MTDAVKDFVVNELLNGAAIDDQDELLLSGLVDSLGVMRLVAFLEQEFGIRIPHQDITIEHFTTIELIGRYLAGRTES